MDETAVSQALSAIVRRLQVETRGTSDDSSVPVVAQRIFADLMRGYVPPSAVVASATVRPLIRDAIDEFLRHKQAEVCRPDTLRVYRAGLRRFAARIGVRPLAEVTGGDITTFLQRSNHPVTRRSIWLILHRFFVWAVRMRYCHENPLAQTLRPRLTVPSHGVIYSPAEAKEILERTRHTEEIGFWVLALFSGLRTEEIKRLQRHQNPWSLVRVEAGVIEVPPALAKRRPRVIRMLPVLRHWLRWVRRREAPFFPPHGKLKTSRTRQAVLKSRWARLSSSARQNMARRSYICYRFGLPGASYTAIAAAAGNSEPIIRKYYRQLVTPAAAHEYFSLTPAKCASLRPLA